MRRKRRPSLRQHAESPHRNANPAGRGANPKPRGAFPAPHGEDFPRQKAFPKRRGVVPMPRGARPKRRGALPMSRGVRPIRRGARPMPHGIHPKPRGERPMPHGESPAALKNAIFREKHRLSPFSRLPLSPSSRCSRLFPIPAAPRTMDISRSASPPNAGAATGSRPRNKKASSPYFISLRMRLAAREVP
jgi:hypothetical protein